MLSTRILGITTVSLLLAAFGCGGGTEQTAAPEKKEEAAATTAEYFKVDPATAATVTGKVTFEGTVPKEPPLNMSAEPDCAKLHSSPVFPKIVDVKDGALANAFVWVKAGLEGKSFEPSATPAELDQKGCVYTPHVVGVQANQQINIINTDPFTHNVHPLPSSNQEWNKSQTAGSAPVEYKFPRQEMMIPVKCNIHPWMRSYISVVNHPFFAVTGEDGAFSLKGLPPGTYTIEVIHEKLGNKESSVTVGPSESKEVTFGYTGA